MESLHPLNYARRIEKPPWNRRAIDALLLGILSGPIGYSSTVRIFGNSRDATAWVCFIFA
jgi:hypothetical protein